MTIMRKLLALLLVLGMVAFTTDYAVAQDGEQTVGEQVIEGAENAAETVGDMAQDAAETVGEAASDLGDAAANAVAPKKFGHQLLKEYFIQGGWQFMALVLVCLILGLAFCIERIITLNLASANTDKLVARVDDALRNGDMAQAKEICKSTPGPAASIIHEGLKRSGGGLESVEKAMVSYGSVQMGLLEKGLVWISLFIAIAPMLGFMGTVIGMITAFDKIEEVGDINPSIVAGGIKVALLTTVFGLITAIILQIFYNYIVSKIDSIVNRMEDASTSLVDVLIDNKVIS